MLNSLRSSNAESSVKHQGVGDGGSSEEDEDNDDADETTTKGLSKKPKRKKRKAEEAELTPAESKSKRVAMTAGWMELVARCELFNIAKADDASHVFDLTFEKLIETDSWDLFSRLSLISAGSTSARREHLPPRTQST